MIMVSYIAAYLGLAVFVIAVVVRILLWVKMPLHVRWELYPVAHEPGKAHYGGSYLEEFEWWTKPRKVSIWGEIKAMAMEILFLVALKEHNPKLWIRSFPFHFGLYLVIACTAIMAGSGILACLWPSLFETSFGGFVQWCVVITGSIGLVLALLGALGLLQRRLTDPDLREYSTKADIINLVLFILVLGFALVTFLLVDRDFSGVMSFWSNLVTLRLEELPASGASAIMPVVSVVLMCLLVAYIPLTHMSHFIVKYFSYHSVRWNDKPNLRGGKEEAAIQEVLGRPISWAALHIRGDGVRSWADVCMENPEQEKTK